MMLRCFARAAHTTRCRPRSCPSRSLSANASSTPIRRIRSVCCARRERPRRVGGHPTQTIICAVYPRSHRAPAPIYARAIKSLALMRGSLRLLGRRPAASPWPTQNISTAEAFLAHMKTARQFITAMPATKTDRSVSGDPRATAHRLSRRVRSKFLRIRHIKKVERLTSFRQRDPGIPQACIMFPLLGVWSWSIGSQTPGRAQEPDGRQLARLLRTCDEWPERDGRRTAEKRYELARFTRSPRRRARAALPAHRVRVRGRSED
jgi:hypothetical protein